MHAQQVDLSSFAAKRVADVWLLFACSSSHPAAAPAPAAAPQQEAAGAISDPGAAALDRQIKALSKKVRQCQALLTRQSAGEALSAQEAEKVAKMPGW